MNATLHYPSTAELDALRQSFCDAQPNCTLDPEKMNGASPYGGARSWEIGDGIGYRRFGPKVRATAKGPRFKISARRAANAMRRKAWTANEWNIHPETVYADEIEGGLPIHRSKPCPEGCLLFPGHWGMHPVGKPSDWPDNAGVQRRAAYEQATAAAPQSLCFFCMMTDGASRAAGHDGRHGAVPVDAEFVRTFPRATAHEEAAFGYALGDPKRPSGW